MKANARFLIEEVGFCLWRQMNNHGNVLVFDNRDLRGTERMMEFHDLQTDVTRIMQGSGRWERICSIRSVPNVFMACLLSVFGKESVKMLEMEFWLGYLRGGTNAIKLGGKIEGNNMHAILICTPILSLFVTTGH